MAAAAATCWNPTTLLCTKNASPKRNTTNTNLVCPKFQEHNATTFSTSLKLQTAARTRLTMLKAGLTDIEPDLNEDPKDRWATQGVAPEDFLYGEYDGHHTFFETNEKETFWEAITQEYNDMGPPTGFQGLISWLFLPAEALGMYFNVPGEYLFIGAGLFVIVFCIIEMDKPDQPHNFEPQIYNMERGARDKLMTAYNTMDIWDFNEKYGELWDFTIEHNDIIKKL